MAYKNSTFAERAGIAAAEPDLKQVDADSEALEVEDKAVTKSETKRPARKKS